MCKIDLYKGDCLEVMDELILKKESFVKNFDEIIEKYDIKEYSQPEFNIPDLKDKKGIILLVGTSGSGKSTILKNNGFEYTDPFNYDMKIIEHFNSGEEAETFLLATGLRSIPTWFKPPNKVSNGEKHRAECALLLSRGIPFIDEFTSVVDRNTAKSLSASLRKYFLKMNLKSIVVASCHKDIIEWLQPDYIYDTDMQQFVKKDSHRRPDIELHIESSSYEDWTYFKKHHYLDTKMSKATHCYTAYINNMKVAFLSIIHGCGRDIKSYWRESRLVVLPEFQGLGIGKTLSNTIAQLYRDKGLRYFSKTAHPSLGEYRNNCDLWKPTSTNMQKRKSYLKKDGTARESKGFGKTKESILRDANRLTYSHEYLGIAKKRIEDTVVEKGLFDD